MFINTKHTYILTFFAFAFLFLQGCKKDEPEDETIPKLEFVSISPSTVKEYEDEIKIAFSYFDGNGDLGENTADVKNLFLTDNRNNVIYEYRISQLAPDGSNIAIRGNLVVSVKNTAITNGSTSESLSYSLYVKDRAGNQSNTITTSAVSVVK
jgi:hypothetical protein